MNRRHGSCRGSWDTYRCSYTDPETWILQRFLRYIWMLRHEPEDMDLAEDPEIHMNAYIRIQRPGSCRGAWDTKMLRHESEDVDFVEYPYWWTLRHESETWLLQRILRYEVYRRHKHISCKHFSCDLSRRLVLGGWRKGSFVAVFLHTVWGRLPV